MSTSSTSREINPKHKRPVPKTILPNWAKEISAHFKTGILIMYKIFKTTLKLYSNKTTPQAYLKLLYLSQL